MSFFLPYLFPPCSELFDGLSCIYMIINSTKRTLENCHTFVDCHRRPFATHCRQQTSGLPQLCRYHAIPKLSPANTFYFAKILSLNVEISTSCSIPDYKPYVVVQNKSEKNKIDKDWLRIKSELDNWPEQSKMINFFSWKILFSVLK